MTDKHYDIPKTPWDLIAKQRVVISKLWDRDYSLDPPVVSLDWPWQPTVEGEPKRMVEDADFDVQVQLERVRHDIERLECSGEVGIPLANVPSFDMIHFGTGPLSTAFGSQIILREGMQPAFEPAFHTADEARRLRKPDLFRDGILPDILKRIEYYNDATQGNVILTPCDTAGPWSIATSIWHYEDMLEAILTDPDAVHHVVSLVADCMIEWYTIQEAYIGRWGRTHTSFSWPYQSRGTIVADDCMVSVSPAIWEEFFLPYNNRISREYGSLTHYHCCMGYDTYFESLIKTDGFIGFDPTKEYNDMDKIEAALVKAKGIWIQPLGPDDIDLIKRLRGRIGMHFAVRGDDREDAIDKTKAFLAALRDMR